jgi:hypothetical protein
VGKGRHSTCYVNLRIARRPARPAHTAREHRGRVQERCAEAYRARPQHVWRTPEARRRDRIVNRSNHSDDHSRSCSRRFTPGKNFQQVFFLHALNTFGSTKHEDLSITSRKLLHVKCRVCRF